MKTLLIIAKLVFLFATPVMAQNFIGLSQSKIIKNFGEPDEKGSNFFVYIDPNEEGTNIYYFDENRQCISFVLTRNSTYYSVYEKRLTKEFDKTSESSFVGRSKNKSFQAEITKNDKEFQICICSFNEKLPSNETDLSAKSNLVTSNN